MLKDEDTFNQCVTSWEGRSGSDYPSPGQLFNDSQNCKEMMILNVLSRTKRKWQFIETARSVAEFTMQNYISVSWVALLAIFMSFHFLLTLDKELISQFP